MENKLVALEFFSTEAEASIAKGFLEANGITAYIFDSDPGLIRSLHLDSNVNFLIRLMVESSVLNEAQELLKRNKNS